jgi:succinate-semialdehyde dehydrogenase/glutarate-semialdehyde dehydrogenase
METCIAAIFVILDEIYDAFYRFTLKNESCKMGEPTDETSYYGPMAESIYEMNYMNKY